jgi:hypothetical protein
MPTDSLDLGPAIREAIIGAAEVSGGLAIYHGQPAVFTRRPVPAEADYPFVIINPDAAISDQDGLTSDRPIVLRDVIFYGLKAEPGDERDQTRVVEAAAYAARGLFHRQKFSVRPVGFSVISITAAGPFAGPVDDDTTVARVVSLTISLRRTA